VSTTPTLPSTFHHPPLDLVGMGIDGDYSFYLGKKVAYVYRGQKEIRGSKIRVIWGKVTRPHGMSPVGPLEAKW
jgi:ribosomal protein L35AE/L33A